MRLLLRNARVLGADRPCDVVLSRGRVSRVADAGAVGADAPAIDLGARLLLPGLVNGHDHLDFSTFPPLGRPHYASVYEWAAHVDRGRGDPQVEKALRVPLVDRLFLGGLRNLLAGVTAAVHHNPPHASLRARTFPIRVLERYAFAHSPGLTNDLRRTYRPNVPWMIHAAEGTDARCRAEVASIAAQNLLRPNTVIIHGIALVPEDLSRLAAARAAVVWCPESNRHLYGATAPVLALRKAGVRIGLGSDSPVSGARDALSNLAAARREGTTGDEALLAMAAEETAEIFGLSPGAVALGAAADFVAVESFEGFLSGDRRAVALVIVTGRPAYGAPGLVSGLGMRGALLRVDGEQRWIQESFGRRASALRRAHPALADVPWIVGVQFP